MISRRHFLKLSAAAGISLALPWKVSLADRAAFSQSPALRKFLQPLPALGTDLPVALPTTDPNPIPGVEYDYYRISIGQYAQQLHPQLPNPTKLWGYADATTGVHKHLGPVIVATRDRPVRITFTNQLPPVHPLPVDTTLPGANLAQNRAATHLHGGHVTWDSDGGPFSWVAPDGSHGESFVNPGTNLGEAIHWYPNDQSARLMWYHDHAMGITRLNAYAGIASGYVIRDAFEQNLIDHFAIPGSIPGTEIPLILQDKIFKQVSDQWGQPGDLWYPSVYDPEILDLNPPGDPPVPSCVPEFFGDTMLVNGRVFPYLNVEPRKYRMRILNACNARFVRLKLVYAQGATFPDSAEPNVNKLGPGLLQIGTEGGFLQEPVLLDGKSSTLLLAPAERADLIVDFSDLPVGATLILYNDAPAPYPDGEPMNDYYPGNKKNRTPSLSGYGPNTRTLLQLRVVTRVGDKDPKPTAPLKLGMDPTPLVPPGTTTPPPGVPVRDLTLNEDFDSYGRLIQRLGTNQRLDADTFSRNYMDDPTETPAVGSTEVWRIFNLTGDTHPIHFHLVNAQIISRQAFHVKDYNGVPSFTGPARPADANETGWKETVRMNPGECTTVIMKFDLPSVPYPVVPSPRTGGNEYVWHCHILEHEEHDMMRPLIVG